MFAHRYFAAHYFAPRYWPLPEFVTRGYWRRARHRTQKIWIELSDEDKLLLAMFDRYLALKRGRARPSGKWAIRKVYQEPHEWRVIYEQDSAQRKTVKRDKE
jgi:hypothetical protein